MSSQSARGHTRSKLCEKSEECCLFWGSIALTGISAVLDILEICLSEKEKKAKEIITGFAIGLTCLTLIFNFCSSASKVNALKKQRDLFFIDPKTGANINDK